MNPDASYEAVIGLEAHAQLSTASKAFCGCSTSFGLAPNGAVCPVCLGLPGALPVLNGQVVEFGILLGLATNCTLSHRSVFARKNYFYPDLPKGYQISQYEDPLCRDGYLEIDLPDGSRKRVGITRIHLEEDAGKSIHHAGVDTLVNVNRCGIPLLEIVSEPELRSAHEAYAFLHKVRQIVTYLGICDGNMEEGSLRCDANVSVRRRGERRFGTKTELKNMNSFRYVEKAIGFEVNRQTTILQEGGVVQHETLLWDAHLNVAVPMRGKEEAHDYRYFPEPDLLPVELSPAAVDDIRARLPELPTARRDRFIAAYGLPHYDADVLTAEKEYADYFESALDEGGSVHKEDYKQMSNWVMTEVLRVAHEKKLPLKTFPVSPDRMAKLVKLIADGSISGKIAKEVFEMMLENQNMPEAIVAERGLAQISDESVIQRTVDAVVTKNPAQVEKYRAGNQKVLGFFVGEVMKSTGGRANPEVVNKLLVRALAK